MKLNLGAGTDIQKSQEWVNLDIVKLPGINVVHDLNKYPWPLETELFDEIRAMDVLEHLDDPVAFVTECWRVLQPGGVLFIQTPRYDAEFLWIDPTHKRGFHEQSMDFFDPLTRYGQTTGFYSKAKFRVKCVIMPNKNLRFSMVKLEA